MSCAPLDKLSRPIWCPSLCTRQAAVNIDNQIAFSASDGILK